MMTASLLAFTLAAVPTTGRYTLRVDSPAKAVRVKLQSDHDDLADWTIYKLDEKAEKYDAISTFQYLQPRKLLVGEKRSRIALLFSASPGQVVAILDHSGKVVREWQLNDLFTNEEQSSIPIDRSTHYGANRFKRSFHVAWFADACLTTDETKLRIETNASNKRQGKISIELDLDNWQVRRIEKVIRD